MVFTQGPLSRGDSLGHDHQNASVTFSSDGDGGTPSISVQAANLWYDIRGTYIVYFVADGCRKNLSLCDLNQTMTDPWRNLRIGDRIRITHIPDDYLRPGYTFHDETRALYEHLIARREILTVDEFCEQELPWVSYEQTMPDGEIVSHSLAVNDDSWELVTEN